MLLENKTYRHFKLIAKLIYINAVQPNRFY